MTLPLVTPGVAGQFGLAGAGLLPAGPDIGSLAAPPFSTSNALAGTTLDLQFAGTGVLDSRISYTGGGGTFFNAAGAITAATTNVARSDYNPVTHAANGLLLEAGRTNFVLNSAVLATQGVSVTVQAYTLSFYGTGSVALSGAFTGSLAGTGAFPVRVSTTFTPAAGTLTLTVTGSVLYASLEAGSFLTSYIATTGAAASRVADVAVLNGSFNVPLTIAWEAIIQQPSTGFGGIDDGAGYNDAAYLASDGSNNLNLTVNVGGASQSTTALVVNLGVVNKYAIALSNGLKQFALNGALSTPITVSQTLPAYTQVALAGYAWSPGTASNVWVRRLRCWSRLLSGAELQAATT